MTQSTSQTIDFGRMEGRVRAGRVLALARLVRPLNLLMVAVGVFVGGFLAEGSRAFDAPLLSNLILAALSVVGIAAGANSLNDVADEEIDRINRPDRPLASGVIGRNVALAVWAAGTFIGLVIAAILSLSHLLIAVAAGALMAVYNYRLKRVPFSGNAVVSILVATSIIYGAMAVDSASAAFYAAGFAFLVTLAREIVKDIEDIRGDLIVGARTLPVVVGVNQARGIAGGIIAATMLATPLPFLFSNYSGLYLLVVLVAAAFLVAALSEILSPNGLMGKASRRLKLAMIAGLAALAFAHALD
jgi:geranylgeranylglycerol-phosphate geranylgeranyltransferase